MTAITITTSTIATTTTVSTTTSFFLDCYLLLQYSIFQNKMSFCAVLLCLLKKTIKHSGPAIHIGIYIYIYQLRIQGTTSAISKSLEMFILPIRKKKNTENTQKEKKKKKIGV